MPIVNFERYCEMLDKAHRDAYAFPAINISNIDTLNAAIEGFVEAESDCLIQVSTGGGAHASAASAASRAPSPLGAAALLAPETTAAWPRSRSPATSAALAGMATARGSWCSQSLSLIHI